jgi:hypothetical protein
MNDKNAQDNIREEIERASEALKASDILFNHRLISDAVSKLYYYLLYHIRALLMTKNLEPRSHEGALRLFSLHFVKSGIFETKASHILSKMMKLREEADYNPSYSFTEEDFTEFRQDVVHVADKIKAYLEKTEE